MTTVLITNIGSSPAIDLARCLRRDPSLRLVGADAGEWGRRIGERLCDSAIALPRVDRERAAYFAAIEEIASRIDFAFFSLDLEIAALAERDRLPPVATALAPLRSVRLFLDKFATFDAAHLPDDFPRTFDIGHEDELPGAFRELTPPVWLRPASGTSGRGSLAARSLEEAVAWIRFWRGRGVAVHWTAQEFLPGRNTNWSGLFVRGRLLGSAVMERLEYFLGDLTMSGVTGQVKLCRTLADPRVDEISERVIRAIDAEPHGLYSVDLREGRDGRPRVTEINPRLAGRPWLYANAGVNLPLAAVRALRDQPAGDALGVFKPGMSLYRQLDVEPVIA